MSNKGKPVTVRQTDGSVRTIGYVDGLCFVTERSEKKHMYRCGAPTLEIALANGSASWGIDTAVCKGLLDAGIQEFMVITPTKFYTVNLSDFIFNDNAFALHHKPHRAQLFLPLRCFKIEKR